MTKQTKADRSEAGKKAAATRKANDAEDQRGDAKAAVKKAGREVKDAVRRTADAASQR